MARELSSEPNFAGVRERFLQNFAEVFGYSEIEKVEDGGWKIEDRDPLSSILHPQVN